jgi:hypothetical protein
VRLLSSTSPAERQLLQCGSRKFYMPILSRPDRVRAKEREAEPKLSRAAIFSTRWCNGYTTLGSYFLANTTQNDSLIIHSIIPILALCLLRMEPTSVKVAKDQLKPGAQISAEYEERAGQKVAKSVQIKG